MLSQSTSRHSVTAPFRAAQKQQGQTTLADEVASPFPKFLMACKLFHCPVRTVQADDYKHKLSGSKSAAKTAGQGKKQGQKQPGAKAQKKQEAPVPLQLSLAAGEVKRWFD